MICTEVQSVLHLYADGELDVERSVEVERHFRECSGCAASLASIRELSLAIGSRASYHGAPEGLAERIRFAAGTKESARKGSRVAHGRYWLAAAAVLFLAASAWLAFIGLPGRFGQPLLAQEVVSAHIRSLMAEHLTDVPSTDQHTVKPWFEGRLDFAPPVLDLTSEGFVLVGGRLDYLQQRPVAALVYQYRKHPINLFICPAGSSGTTAPTESSRDGYTLAHWQQEGMVFWAISDASASVLRDFIKAMRDGAPTGQP
jgi:anti-sigma factor RsiW